MISKKNDISIIFSFNIGKKNGLGNYRRLKPLIEYYKNKFNVIIFTNNIDQVDIDVKKIKVHEKNEEYKILKLIKKDSHKKFISIFDKNKNYSRKFLKSLSVLSKIVLFHNFYLNSKFADLVIFPIEHFLNRDIKKINKIRTFKNKIFYGKDYIIYNKDVLKQKKKTIKKNFIAVTTGGADTYNLNYKILSSILNKKLNEKYKFKFLLGSNVKNHNFKKKYKNIIFKKFNYEDLFSANLVITTFGITTYELLLFNQKIINICYNSINKKRSEVLDKKINFIKSISINSISKFTFTNIIYDLILKKIKFYTFPANGVNKVQKIINKLIDEK